MKLDRVRDLTKERFVEEYLLPHRPVIITDAMNNWQIEKFTPAHLEKAFGDHEVQVYNDLFDLQTIDTLATYFKDNFNKSANEERSNEYIRWYTQLKDIDFYWSDAVFKELEKYWGHPYFLPNDSFAIPYAADGKRINAHEERFPYKGLFISGKGARTRLHRDPFNSNAILCQFYGEKKIYLYDPGQAEYVMNNNEFVDIAAPDLDKFPQYTRATCAYEDTLAPGEIIYFPAGWFHDVTSATDSISITWNFVHVSELQTLCAYIETHPGDDQLEIVKFFLKDRVPEDADAEAIVNFLKKEMAASYGIGL
jgi:ribosomal protein L16 Arg81 hydroxylase